jgi:UDP-glucose 6-dehydrogenase
MSLDIRSAGMLGCPKTELPRLIKESEGVIGIIGQGFVGSALKEYFKDTLKVVVYDKAKPELGTLSEVVKQAQVIFVCVPTPMVLETGGCFTGIVESVLEDIKVEALSVGRSLDSFVVVIKSTVYPTFCEEMSATHFPMRICFSPEFLT